MKKDKKSKALEFNQLLSEWDGANASFISFTDSHFNVFAIKLEFPVNGKKFGIGLSRCTYISGMISWDNASLSIIYDESNLLYIISDEKSGFLVKCVDLLMGENLDEEYELGILFKK